MTAAERHFSPLIIADKTWYSVQDVAEILGRSDQYVRDCCEFGHLRGHRLKGRIHKPGSGRARYQIHRDALVLFLLTTANYDPQDYADELAGVLGRLDLKVFREVVRRSGQPAPFT